MPGNIQDQIGWDFEQPGRVDEGPGHCRGIGLDEL